MPVGDLAHYGDRRLDDFVEITEEPPGVMVAIPVKRNKVRDVLELELQNLVVSHFNRTVCQSIDIRRRKGPGVAANRLEAGRDPGPSGIRDDLEGNWMWGQSSGKHEDSRS